jgi:hypothetical protein
METLPQGQMPTLPYPVILDWQQLEDVGVVFEGRFQSELVTLDDVEAFSRLMRRLVEAVDSELHNRSELGQFVLVTDVVVTGGSFKIVAKLKSLNPLHWNAGNKNAAAIILAAVIGLAGPTPRPPPPPSAPVQQVISPECVSKAAEAGRDFNANVRKLPKSGSAVFSVSCGPFQEKIEYHWDNKPPNR